MKIIFIRHGETSGNLHKRYIGKTDEPLCKKGIINLNKNSYPKCDVVISSPMKRCIETSKIIYSNKNPIIYDGLRECDFGDFEGKNYLELSGNSDYQRWIDSGGKMSFPNGESIEIFKKRCVYTFKKAVSIFHENDVIAFVVHGGTIMSILEKYAVPKKDYYDYMIKNGEYYLTVYDEKNIRIIGE